MNVISISAERLARRGGLGLRPVAGVRHHHLPCGPLMDFYGMQVRRSDLEKAGLIEAEAC